MRLVSHRHRFVLVTIPKNGCVTLRYLFHYLEQGRLQEYEALTARPSGNIHVECRRRYGDRLPGPDYEVFAALRNPWERVVSAHAEKVVSKGWLSRTGIRSLSDFVRFLELVGVERPSCDQHWRAQHTFIGEGPVQLLRMRHLQADVDAMFASLGLPLVRLPNWKAGASAPYKERYSPREAELVGRLYARDVALGGHTCPERLVDEGKKESAFGTGFDARCRLHRAGAASVLVLRRALGRNIW